MNFAVTASLEAYRRADTVGWTTCAKRISDDIGEWAAEKLESTQASEVLIPESADGAQISDLLMGLMLAPEFVGGLLSADVRPERLERFREKTESRIRADMTEHILNLLTTSFLSGRTFGAPIKPDGRYVSFTRCPFVRRFI